ncbi:MAG: T9SS type A sorting domain-containing protein [Elusimicrobia bacterium]|nr:T9SS type A sorting domain-containing protein [Elusimicrobiota bacterium]
MKNNFLRLLPLIAWLAAPSPASCGWDKIRYSEAPLAVVRASTGTFEVSYTVGDACASPAMLEADPSSVWSGYLSLAPADALNQGLASYSSTSSVRSDGALWGMTPGAGLELAFSDEISPEVSDPQVSATQLYDNAGAVSNSSWPVTLAYSGQKLIVMPSGSWPKGSVFSVTFSSAIVDINGSPLSSAATVYFSVIMDHTADNVAAAFSDRRVRVAIPANAYAQDFFVSMSTDPGTQAVRDANGRLDSLPGSPRFVNTVGVTPYDLAGSTVQPNSACVITLPYPDSDNDGLIDGSAGRLRASSLSVWRLEEGSGVWERQGGASIDTAGHTVSQRVTHFSNYALMALPDTEVGYVYASPVPFRPGAGDTARYGSWADGITFRGLPSEGKIRIYTVSGVLVRQLEVAPPTVNWDVKNSDGQRVASGVYIWEVTSGRNRKTGKLVVIK